MTQTCADAVADEKVLFVVSKAPKPPLFSRFGTALICAALLLAVGAVCTRHVYLLSAQPPLVSADSVLHLRPAP